MVQQAFNTLREKLVMASVLHMPDLTLTQLIVEVDASNSGVGAVLSHRLTPFERNYNVRDRELMAVRLAILEWRHWLEGAKHQVLIWKRS